MIASALFLAATLTWMQPFYKVYHYCTVFVQDEQVATVNTDVLHQEWPGGDGFRRFRWDLADSLFSTDSRVEMACCITGGECTELTPAPIQIGKPPPEWTEFGSTADSYIFVGKPTLPCAGDCNADGKVTVDELVRLVGMSKGQLAITACRAGDLDGNQQIRINELIAAVNSHLNGCK